MQLRSYSVTLEIVTRNFAILVIGATDLTNHANLVNFLLHYLTLLQVY